MGQRVRLVRAAAEVAEEDMETPGENYALATEAENKPPAIVVEGQAEYEESNPEDNAVKKEEAPRGWGGELSIGTKIKRFQEYQNDLTKETHSKVELEQFSIGITTNSHKR